MDSKAFDFLPNENTFTSLYHIQQTVDTVSGKNPNHMLSLAQKISATLARATPIWKKSNVIPKNCALRFIFMSPSIR